MNLLQVLQELPAELRYETLLKLPFGEVIQQCNQLPELRETCNSDYFWYRYTIGHMREHISRAEFDNLPLDNKTKYLYYYVTRMNPLPSHENSDVNSVVNVLINRLHLAIKVRSIPLYLYLYYQYRDNILSVKHTVPSNVFLPDLLLTVETNQLQFFLTLMELFNINLTNYSALFTYATSHGAIDILRWIIAHGYYAPTSNGLISLMNEISNSKSIEVRDKNFRTFQYLLSEYIKHTGELTYTYLALLEKARELRDPELIGYITDLMNYVETLSQTLG